MIKHTPTPWTIPERDGHVIRAQGRTIVVVLETGHPDEEEANGYLVEAAPDTTDALLDALAWWYDQIMDVDGGPDGYRMHRPDWVIAGEEAYAKAHGVTGVRNVWEFMQQEIYKRIESEKAERLVCAADNEREARRESNHG